MDETDMFVGKKETTSSILSKLRVAYMIYSNKLDFHEIRGIPKEMMNFRKWQCWIEDNG